MTLRMLYSLSNPAQNVHVANARSFINNTAIVNLSNDRVTNSALKNLVKCGAGLMAFPDTDVHTALICKDKEPL